MHSAQISAVRAIGECINISSDWGRKDFLSGGQSQVVRPLRACAAAGRLSRRNAAYDAATESFLSAAIECPVVGSNTCRRWSAFGSTDVRLPAAR